MRLDAASAMPSTRPRDSAPAFSTDIKNAGNTDATISEEKSLKKLVSPRKKTLRGRPRILSFIIWVCVYPKKSPGGYRACWITGLEVWGHNPECNSDQPSLSGPTSNTLMGLLD